MAPIEVPDMLIQYHIFRYSL